MSWLDVQDVFTYGYAQTSFFGCNSNICSLTLNLIPRLVTCATLQPYFSFRKPDKNKDTDGYMHDVHELNNNEIGRCMKTFLDKWLVGYDRLRR